MSLCQEGQLVPEEAMDCVPKWSETAVPEWKAKCEPFAQHDSIQLPHDPALLHLFSASRPLVLQNEAETARYPRTVRETPQEKAPLVSPLLLVALISPQHCGRK